MKQRKKTNVVLGHESQGGQQDIRGLKNYHLLTQTFEKLEMCSVVFSPFPAMFSNIPTNTFMAH